MPDTQQQWLEEQLILVESSTGFVMPVEVARDWASYLASAWPSSPQGIAARQMVEVLKRAEAIAALAAFSSYELLAGGQAIGRLGPILRTALDTARKAGVA